MKHTNTEMHTENDRKRQDTWYHKRARQLVTPRVTDMTEEKEPEKHANAHESQT